MTCNVTGLKAHWRVTFENQDVQCYNSIRTMVNVFRSMNIPITVHNMANIDRSAKNTPLPESRINRFRENGVIGIEKINVRTLFSPQ